MPLLLLCAVVAHSKAQEAFHSVAVHIIATSSSWQVIILVSLVQRFIGSEDMKGDEVVGGHKERRVQRRRKQKI